MTAPREILPGRTYLLSRRCTQRQCLLRPDHKTNRAFRYCLAEAAKRFGIKLIAWVAMSNHYHAVVYDPLGALPAFLAHFHKMSAKVLNARWGRWENLWATESTCATVLIEDADVFDKVVYVLSNPVADHLVERAVHWPGDNSLRQLDGRPVVVQRPKIFFRERGAMPAAVTLQAELPDSWAPRGRQEWVERVNAAIAKREQAARDERVARGLRVAGRRTVRRMSALHRPASREPRRNLRPAIACKRWAARVEAVRCLRIFRQRYADARARLVRGEQGVVFPAGTYALRRLGFPCAPYPSALQLT